MNRIRNLLQPFLILAVSFLAGGILSPLFAQDAAAGGLEQLRKCAVSRFDDGYTAGQRFEDIQAERFAVSGGRA